MDSSTIRMDKFQVGDRVEWSGEHYASINDGEKTLGKGPFIVTKVIDRPEIHDVNKSGPSWWQIMGHTQHVVIKEDPTIKIGTHVVEHLYSGAFFRKIPQ